MKKGRPPNELQPQLTGHYLDKKGLLTLLKTLSSTQRCSQVLSTRLSLLSVGMGIGENPETEVEFHY